MKAVFKYIFLKLSEEYRFFKKLKLLTNISFSEYVHLKFLKDEANATIFGSPIKVTDSFWHLHSIHEIFIDGAFEFNDYSDNPTIIDCGANIGLSSIFFKKLYPKAEILAFEADPEIFKMLIHNIKALGFDDITAINKAVWKENVPLKFKASGALGGAITTEDSIDKEGNNTVTIPAVRLRDVIQRFDKIDFLKIDIEGAEIEVLRDCKDYLYKVKNLFVEFHRLNRQNINLYEFIELIECSGFRIYIKEAWNNLSKPYLRNIFNPYFDLQLNIFAYR